MEFDYSKQPGLKLLDRNLNKEGFPLVSIITPFYNSGKNFEQTYKCVINQTFPWFEWIIVDDGSTREVDLDILEKFKLMDSRIRVLHKENGGTSSARNLGIKNSSTEIIIPLDSDDIIGPTFVEVIYMGLFFNPKASWCYTDSVGFGTSEYIWEKKFCSDRMKVENLLVCTAGIRKKDIEEVGFYNETEKHFDEDWALWLKLIGLGKYPVHLNIKEFWYRRNDEGKMSTVMKDKAVKATSNRIIDELGKCIKKPVLAKEYPSAGKTNSFIKPKVSNFERKVFVDKKKINVMMLIPWMEMGGADLFNLDVVKMIDKSRFEMSILTTVPGKNTWRQKFEEYVTDIFELPSFLDVENYAEFISYFIKSREIDILFLTNSYFGYYLVPWLRKNFPELVILDYIHMEEWYWRNGGYARTSGAVGEILEKTYLCNDRTRRIMIEKFNRRPESVDTLYIGVDKDKYDSRKIIGGKVKEKYRIEKSNPIVLFPCRMHPQKRPFLMIEIAKELKKKLPKVVFMVVGDGPQLEELKMKSVSEKLEDTLIFAGRQEDMLPFYKDSNVTLICSLKEGLALTAYESCSMGVPVVSSDVGGQRELVDDKAGALLPLLQSEENDLDSRVFDYDEVKLYVDALYEILTNELKYDQLSKNCRERIEDKFSSQIMIRKLEDEFELFVKEEKFRIYRLSMSEKLQSLGFFADDYATAFSEIENVDLSYKLGYENDLKYELMRLANSRWGGRIIRLAFKLKLNKIFK